MNFCSKHQWKDKHCPTCNAASKKYRGGYVVKERPIIFSGPMVQAIIDGRKTQTRRIIKPQPMHCADMPMGKDMTYASACPFGRPGDRLWVRETYAQHPEFPSEVIYRADRGGNYQGAAQGDFKWKPSIYMPRWASRITLEVQSVRVERLQDITEDDARQEGVSLRGTTRHKHECRHAFDALWESIHGPGSWDNNPWVWVVEFHKIKS